MTESNYTSITDSEIVEACFDSYRVAIVIPALNESATIVSVVESVASYDVPIIVDDGLTAGTSKMARRAGAIIVCNCQEITFTSSSKVVSLR